MVQEGKWGYGAEKTYDNREGAEIIEPFMVQVPNQGKKRHKMCSSGNCAWLGKGERLRNKGSSGVLGG